jgi:Uma2 family endonuclease
MEGASVRTRKWTRVEYDRLIDAEILGSADRIELLGGEMIVKEPQPSPHATAIRLAQRVLTAAFGPGWDVRAQLPLALDDESEPEPDVVVVAGRPADYRRAHPAHPALVVEVAESSLELDRSHKGGLYARAGIEDYWIVNLPMRVLEVHRDPAADATAPYGWRYRSVATLRPVDVVTPLAFPSGPIVVADLLP